MTTRPSQSAASDDRHRAELQEIRSRVKAAGRTSGLTYRSASSLASAVSNELRAADQLLAAGHAESAVGVIECGIKVIEKAFSMVDDSRGILGDLIRRLQRDHADACERSTLDRTKLAARLAKWAMNSDWEVFLESPTTHADALGEAGLDRFEAEVDKHYRLLGPLGPGESDERDGKVSAFNVNHLKTLLAARHGPDAVVQVLARDLSYSYHYLKIAKVLTDAGRDDEAMEWLERGQAPSTAVATGASTITPPSCTPESAGSIPRPRWRPHDSPKPRRPNCLIVFGTSRPDPAIGSNAAQRPSRCWPLSRRPHHWMSRRHRGGTRWATPSWSRSS